MTIHDHDHDLDYGRLDQGDDGRWVLRFTRQLPHTPKKIWQALTEPEHLAVWFPSDIEGERAEGAKLRFVFREGEGPTMDGEMLAFDPPSLMELRWGDEILRFELRPEGEGSALEFTNIFDDVGKAARDAAGWHSCLDLLAYDVDGREPPWPSNERWKQVHGDYKERFGPEASTIGPPEDWERVYGDG